MSGYITHDFIGACFFSRCSVYFHLYIKAKRERVVIFVLSARLDACCESAVVVLFQEFYLALNGELVPPHKVGYSGN